MDVRNLHPDSVDGTRQTPLMLAT
jgi:ankyrin repeat protein